MVLPAPGQASRRKAWRVWRWAEGMARRCHARSDTDSGHEAGWMGRFT